MFRLTLLGGASIERHDGVLLVGRVAQRHRLGLLALLACASGRGLSRDKLIGLLWPESDTERARNLLNVSVYELRKALGDDALLSGSDELRLNLETVASDVAQFEAALDRGDHEAAVALYRGPLLDGFFVDGAPEFEQWVNRERARLASAYARALETLADAAERRGDFKGAAEWWGRLAVHDPYDSRVALRLMRALRASGNVAGALQHASVHERLLQQELGLQAPSQVSALAERMRAEPLTESSPVASEVAEPAPPSVASTDDNAQTPMPALRPPSAAPQPPGFPGSSDRRRVRAISVVVIGIAVIAGVAWAFRPAASKPERSLAVLPFINMSPDADNEYFSDGLTEEISARLSAAPELKVISRTSAMHYKGSTKSLREIARELRVAHVLEGSVRRQGDSVRITAQLIDAGADRHLWSRSYDRELVNVLGIQDEIAREVARSLAIELAGKAGALATRGTRDPKAYEFYRRGRYFWNRRTKEGHEQAIAYFQQAIARDSTYAEPYAGLADAYLTSYQLNFDTAPEAEIYSRMRSAAQRALALDDQSADAHVSFGVARWWQKDWPGAEREIRRAIELNPGHATARSWYGLLLMGMGRLDEAVQQSRRATELDPFALVANDNHGRVCYAARDYDCVIEQARHALEVDGSWASAHGVLVLAYAKKGMYDEAMRSATKAVEFGGPLTPTFQARLAYVLALVGRNAEAVQVLQQAKAIPQNGVDIARAYVALGESDSAFAWLNRANWRWPHRGVLADPALDPLRSDPRFAQLSLRVGREMGIR